MDTVTSTAVYRRKCVQMESQTTLKLINEISNNNTRVLEGLKASKDDPNYIDNICQYQYDSQVTILQVNLILQKFLKIPIPVLPNDNTSMIALEESSNLKTSFSLIDIPNLPSIEHTTLNGTLPSLSENSDLCDEQLKIQDISEIETKVCNQAEEELETSCNQIVIATEKDESNEEEAREKTISSSDFSNNEIYKPVQVRSKCKYNFAQIPFNTKNVQRKPIVSDFTNVVEKQDVIPDKNDQTWKEPTRNYADILKRNNNEIEENKSSKTVGSNFFYTDFASKTNSKQCGTLWTSLKSSSCTSQKFSYKALPNKKQQQTKGTRLPDPQICDQDIHKNVPLKHSGSENPKNLESASLPLESVSRQKELLDLQQTWQKQSERANSETPERALPSLESVSRQEKLLDPQQTLKEQLESTKSETFRSASSSLESVSDQTELLDSQQTSEKHSERANSESPLSASRSLESSSDQVLESASPSLESVSGQKKLLDPQHTWWKQHSESANSETYKPELLDSQQTSEKHSERANSESPLSASRSLESSSDQVLESASPSLELVSGQKKLLDPQHTWKQHSESANSETYKTELLDSQQTSEKHSERANSESPLSASRSLESSSDQVLESASPSLELVSGQKKLLDPQHTWKQHSESANSETYKTELLDSQQTSEKHSERANSESPLSASRSLESSSDQVLESASPSLESVSSQKKLLDPQHTWKQHSESANSETYKSASPSLKSASALSKSSNSKTYYSAVQQSKSVYRSDNRIKKTPNQVSHTPDFTEGEDNETFMMPTLENSSWWESKAPENNKEKGKNIVDQLKRKNIMSIEERHRRNIPRARMPDISIKPSSMKLSQKKKSILRTTDSEEEIEEPWSEKSDYRMIQENEEVDSKLVVPEAREPNHDDFFMISDIKSPGVFYIQVANEINMVIDDLADSMDTFYKNKHFIPFSSKFEAKKEMGNFFCINIDDLWLRVEVIDWYITNHKTIIVQAIDYGDFYKKDFHELRPLPLELYNYPKIAQRCHLADLYPINSYSNCPGRQWERISNSAFVQHCGNILKVHFQFITRHYCSIRKSYGIDFKMANGESIANILVREKKAIRIVNKRTDFFEDLGLTNKISFDSSDMLMEQNWNAYWYNQNIKSTSKHCTSSYNSTSRTGGKFKTPPQELAVTQLYCKQDLPCEGEERRIIITHVVDIETFYAHIDSGSFVHPGEFLHNFHEYMNKYHTVKTYTSLTRTPVENQLVVAPHPNYFWSRAQVRQIGVPDRNDQVHAELFFIDYGCVLWVPLSAVRNIPKFLLEIPSLAIEFKMYNIQHKLGTNREMEKEFLELYFNVELIAVVKAVPGHVVVQLLDKYSIDIGEILINHGIGEWKKDNIFPCSDNYLLID